jgi:hypothetical protein
MNRVHLAALKQIGVDVVVGNLIFGGFNVKQ